MPEPYESEQTLDIEVTLRFQTDTGVPAEIVSDLLKEVSRSIYRAEREELNEIFELLPNLTSVERDAMRFRFEQVDSDRALNVEYGGRGSLLLFGAAAGLAYWVVDKTMGETLKEAWVESSGHANLKAFLKTRVFAKRDRIANRFRPIRYGIETAHFAAVSSDAQNEPSLIVDVIVDSDSRIPRPSEITKARESR